MRHNQNDDNNSDIDCMCSVCSTCVPKIHKTLKYTSFLPPYTPYKQ